MEAGKCWWLSNLRGGHYATIVGTARRRARPRHGRQHNRSVATGRRERRSNLQARTPALPTLELASPASLPPVRLFLLYPNHSGYSPWLVAPLLRSGAASTKTLGNEPPRKKLEQPHFENYKEKLSAGGTQLPLSSAQLWRQHPLCV